MVLEKHTIRSITSTRWGWISKRNRMWIRARWLTVRNMIYLKKGSKQPAQWPFRDWKTNLRTM